MFRVKKFNVFKIFKYKDKVIRNKLYLIIKVTDVRSKTLILTPRICTLKKKII